MRLSASELAIGYPRGEAVVLLRQNAKRMRSS
jgi:hypothetical protein